MSAELAEIEILPVTGVRENGVAEMTDVAGPVLLDIPHDPDSTEIGTSPVAVSERIEGGRTDIAGALHTTDYPLPHVLEEGINPFTPAEFENIFLKNVVKEVDIGGIEYEVSFNRRENALTIQRDVNRITFKNPRELREMIEILRYELQLCTLEHNRVALSKHEQEFGDANNGRIYVSSDVLDNMTHDFSWLADRAQPSEETTVYNGVGRDGFGNRVIAQLNLNPEGGNNKTPLMRYISLPRFGSISLRDGSHFVNLLLVLYRAWRKVSYS